MKVSENLNVKNTKRVQIDGSYIKLSYSNVIALLEMLNLCE